MASKHRSIALMPLLGLCLTVCSSTSGAERSVPFPAAVNASGITQKNLSPMSQHALLLGNGDINGLLFCEGANLVLRVTKNDVWDARLDTSNDPPLPTLERVKELAAGEWENRSWILPEGYKLKGRDGYHAYPYPCPRPCVLVRVGHRATGGGGTSAGRWRRIRAQGAVNKWQRRGDAAVMTVAGKAGASNGWAFAPVAISTDAYPKLRVRLCGSENARYFVDLIGRPRRMILNSKWIETPTTPGGRVFDLPAGQTVEKVILYTWSEDGKPAENRFEAVTFEGAGGKLEVDLSAKAVNAPVGGGAAFLSVLRAEAVVSGVKEGPPAATVMALADRNVFLIVTEGQSIRLEALPLSRTPPPKTGRQGEIEYVTQAFPGDGDWGGMSHAVALARTKTHALVAVVTSLEARDPLAAAVRLLTDTLAVKATQLVRTHHAEWRRFWSASGIDVDDEFLRDLWYRNLYFLRCVSKPGVECIGLYASLVGNGVPAWHGNHTLNYNNQQTFWSAFPTNHVELAQPYAALISRYLPRARWLCKRVFGFEGAYIPHVVLSHEPPDPTKCKTHNRRQYLHHVWGMTIGVSGFAVQNLWLQYKYAPDRALLAKTAYPAVRDVARFYANFVDQCERDAGGKVVLAPSVSPEHWGWHPKLARNRNCAFDIAYARWTLGAAIEGARTLGRDKELAARFERALTLLPLYPTTKTEKPVVVDVQDAPPITYNIVVPATPVFPADLVTWRSPAAQRELFARTIKSLRWNGNNSSILLPVARARLSMPGTFEYLKSTLGARLRPNGTLGLNRIGSGINRNGHYTEQFAASMAVTELLLQSVGDVIRVFPAWPREENAAFRALRAQGGFLVSAGLTDGKIGPVEITSTVGGPLQLKSPWPTIRRRGQEPTLPAPDSHGIVRLKTRPGQRMVFEPGPLPSPNTAPKAPAQ